MLICTLSIKKGVKNTFLESPFLIQLAHSDKFIKKETPTSSHRLVKVWLLHLESFMSQIYHHSFDETNNSISKGDTTRTFSEFFYFHVK